MRAANLMANNTTIPRLIRRILVIFALQTIHCRESLQHLFHFKILSAILKVNRIHAPKVILTAALVELRYNPTRLIDVTQNLIQADLKCSVDCFDLSNIALDLFHTIIHTLLLNNRNLIVEGYLTGFDLLLCQKHQRPHLIIRETREVKGGGAHD